PCDHGAAVHHLHHARRVRIRAGGAEGSRLRRRLHHLGGGAFRRDPVHADRHHRRRHARARPRARRDHGRHLRDRKRPQDIGVAAGARHNYFGNDRQRVHRGGRRPLHVVADCARPHPVRHHLHRPRGRALHAAAPREAGWRLIMNPLYARRRLRNKVAMTLSLLATCFGAGWLVLILAVLLWEGFSRLSLQVFTEMTPPPGADGGLLNAIVGSLMVTVIAVLIGTPIGILAGTYMAEYGRYAKLTLVVRFINDILLSAPSIVVGLFIYEVMVAPMGHFSGIAGAVALAVLVIPVVVRTT